MARVIVALGIAIFAIYAGTTLGRTLFVSADTANFEGQTPYWKIYQNDVYGFSLRFDDSWRGVRRIEKKEVSQSGIVIRRFFFALPTGDIVYPTGFAQPLIVTLYPLNAPAWMYAGEAKLGQNEHYLFTARLWEEPASDLVSKGVDPELVADTFDLI